MEEISNVDQNILKDNPMNSENKEQHIETAKETLKKSIDAVNVELSKVIKNS